MSSHDNNDSDDEEKEAISLKDQAKINRSD